MEDNKELMVNEENENKGGLIKSFAEMQKRSKTECEMYTNITDKKKLFNIESKVDYLLNDCENESLRIVGVLIKIYRKPLAEPIVNEETGEILKEFETTMSTVLVDDSGTSYATGSKMFAIQLIRYIQMWGMEEFENGLEIKIVKNKTQNGNKALGFELI